MEQSQRMLLKNNATRLKAMRLILYEPGNSIAFGIYADYFFNLVLVSFSQICCCLI